MNFRWTDRLRLLTLQPGVTSNDRGELLLRGGKPGDAALYLNGVPILSGFRSKPFFGLTLSRVLESRAGIPPNAVESITLETGEMAAELGNGESGAISIRTRDYSERRCQRVFRHEAIEAQNVLRSQLLLAMQ
jgi:hypothetical protein